MAIEFPEYLVFKNALTKEYVNIVLEKIQENNLIEPHPFGNFEGIKVDYSLIDPENKIKQILEDAEQYFRKTYASEKRELRLSRSYGTIMKPGAMIGDHKDLYNSGREHDFSYGDALVCNIYLSECDGGELTFSEIGVELKVSPGDVVLFPAHLLTHSVKTVIKGNRITLLNHFSLLSEEDTKQIDSIHEKFKK
jgi:hypothetical protein